MRKTILVLGAIACAIPVIAFATEPADDPRPNSHFAHCEGQGEAERCSMDFNTDKEGDDENKDRITHLNIYSKCAPVPVRPKGFWPNVPVSKGHFKVVARDPEDQVTDFTGEKLKYDIEGRFVTPTKAVGTYNIDSPSSNCKDRDRKFEAKRVDKARRTF